MNKTKKYTLVAVILLALGIGAGTVYAESNGLRMGFRAELAEKLDMDVDELDGIMEEIRSEHRVEMQAERAELILQAIEDGKLTDRQAEILSAMQDISPGGKGMFGAGSGMTEQERENLRNQMREERETRMIDMLNEQGLDVTHEEISELKELKLELGLGGEMHRGGRNR
jgi:hypothetical protein